MCSVSVGPICSMKKMVGRLGGIFVHCINTRGCV